LLLKHGADAAANHSGALKRAVAARQFDLAQKLLVAGAHASDLDHTAILTTTKAKQWPFLIALLQCGISVATTILPPDQAVDFFARVTPTNLLRDIQGHLLPASTLAERQQFVNTTGNAAAKQSGEVAVMVACWLTKFLIELNSRA
jgi:hypothetical protein